MNFKKILAIGAHPDDIEFSCLGLLLKAKFIGANITVFIASNGSAGDPSSGTHRIKESTSALSCLGCHELIAIDTPGVDQNKYEEISNIIRTLILEKSPDLILVHDKNDTHQEHRFLHDIVITASRRVSTSILTYKSVSVTASFSEKFYIDITDFFDIKAIAISKHLSQKNCEYMTDESVQSYHYNWFGRMHGIKYVESYGIEQIIIK
jgi:LmbE family N-acetylglucosaminyl deacetylase